MKYRKQTSLSMDPKTADEAKKWADVERIQLSTYVSMAVEQRNKWHQRQEQKAIQETNKLTKDEAKKELIKELEERNRQNKEDRGIEEMLKAAKEFWSEK